MKKKTIVWILVVVIAVLAVGGAIAAGVTLTKSDFVELGEGGLCLGCPSCHYPLCSFGK